MFKSSTLGVFSLILLFLFVVADNTFVTSSNVITYTSDVGEYIVSVLCIVWIVSAFVAAFILALRE